MKTTVIIDTVVFTKTSTVRLMNIYKMMARNFIHDIESEKLKEGERMPSLRQLSRQQAVSMSTAISCYQELESQGWIYSRPQAGYYVSRRSSKDRTPNWAAFESKVSSVTKNFVTQSQHSGPLGVSSCTLDDLALKELTRSFRRSNERLGHRVNHYPDSIGNSLLRNALGKHFTRLGLGINEGELVITSGCMSAIKVALEVCTKEGDAVAISSPCFSGILELLGRMGRNIVEIPSLDDGIDLLQLEAHFECGSVKAGLFCTSHMNPQGITMSVAQKKTLAYLANYYRVPIIEDDVYIELSYADYLPLPAKYYDRNGYILWCGSVSKSLSPSYRLGWCLPGLFTQRYQEQHNAMCFGVSLPIQLAVADFIESGQYAKHIQRRRKKLFRLRQEYTELLSKLLPPNIKISDPQGGMVLWLQIPNLNFVNFKRMLLKSNVDVRLGNLFSTQDIYDNCLRINIGSEITCEVMCELKKLAHAIQESV